MHLFSLHYLPSISYLQSLLKADAITFEMMEHYQRQTYRNRCEIYTADGVHKLVVPIDHQSGVKARKVMRDVRIAYQDPWQMQHRRTIQSAYQSSSYYEYFEAEFVKLFETKHVFLADLNLATLEMLFKFLKKPFEFSRTEEYFRLPVGMEDHREAFQNREDGNVPEYYQVFQSRKGYIKNLSSIDMLFNCGPQKMKENLGV